MIGFILGFSTTLNIILIIIFIIAYKNLKRKFLTPKIEPNKYESNIDLNKYTEDAVKSIFRGMKL